jgi:glycosyltransferase involved in cell wall biosynthesis
MSDHCDVLLVALADVTRDARTVNLARALSARGLAVSVLGGFRQQQSEPFTQIAWHDPGGRALRRWWSLTRTCAALSISAKLVIAMDVFALAGSSLIAKRSKAKLFYDMRELNFALGPLKGRGLKQTIITRHEERQLRHVNTIIVSGDLDADLIQERFALTKRPTVLLNTPPYKDVVQSPLRHACGVSASVPLVIYQGVVHHGRGLEPFFHAMEHMPDVHLAVLGDGPAMSELQRRAQQIGLGDRVHWLGSVPYDELHAYTCGADAGLCLIEPLSLSYEYALPNKLFEYMNARIPSIVSDLPALRLHIDTYPVGGLVGRTLEPREIAQVTQRLLDEKNAASMRTACESIRELSYEQQVAHVIKEIEEALQRT